MRTVARRRSAAIITDFSHCGLELAEDRHGTNRQDEHDN